MSKIDKNRSLFEQKGKRLIQDVRNMEDIDSAHVDQSWLELKYMLKQSSRLKLRRQILFIALSVAAMVAVIILSFVFLKKSHPDPLLSVDLLNDSVIFDSGDILLYSSNSIQKIADESEVIYDTDGILHVDAASIQEKYDHNEQTKFNKVIVPKGKRIKVKLSDGTLVHINSASQLIYPSVLAADKREVIIDGEAFFEVKKDENRPFIVKTKKLDIKVLGTSFNVNSYQENISFVALKEGRVEVTTLLNKKIELKPNQLLTLSNDNIQLEEVDINEYTAWLDDVMYLTNKNCGIVLNQLSQYYGVKIYYDSQVANIPTGGKLDLRNGLEQALNILSVSFDLSYKEDDSGNINITLK